MKTPQEIYTEAHSAGMAAGHGCTPTPMVVGTPTTPLGDDIDYGRGLRKYLGYHGNSWDLRNIYLNIKLNRILL